MEVLEEAYSGVEVHVRVVVASFAETEEHEHDAKMGAAVKHVRRADVEYPLQRQLLLQKDDEDQVVKTDLEWLLEGDHQLRMKVTLVQEPFLVYAT